MLGARCTATPSSPVSGCTLTIIFPVFGAQTLLIDPVHAPGCPVHLPVHAPAEPPGARTRCSRCPPRLGACTHRTAPIQPPGAGAQRPAPRIHPVPTPCAGARRLSQCPVQTSGAGTRHPLQCMCPMLAASPVHAPGPNAHRPPRCRRYSEHTAGAGLHRPPRSRCRCHCPVPVPDPVPLPGARIPARKRTPRPGDVTSPSTPRRWSLANAGVCRARPPHVPPAPRRCLRSAAPARPPRCAVRPARPALAAGAGASAGPRRAEPPRRPGDLPRVSAECPARRGRSRAPRLAAVPRSRPRPLPTSRGTSPGDRGARAGAGGRVGGAPAATPALPGTHRGVGTRVWCVPRPAAAPVRPALPGSRRAALLFAAIGSPEIETYIQRNYIKNLPTRPLCGRPAPWGCPGLGCLSVTSVSFVLVLFFSLFWVFRGREVLFSSPCWLLAPGTEGRQTPLVSQLGSKGAGHEWVFLWHLELSGPGTDRDVSRRHLPHHTGRKMEPLLSDVPEAM